MAGDAATGGSGGGGAGCGAVEIGMPNGAGLVLHLANTAASPGFCQDCWLVPRGNADDGDGPCADRTAAAAQPRTTAIAFLAVMRVTLSQRLNGFGTFKTSIIEGCREDS